MENTKAPSRPSILDRLRSLQFRFTRTLLFWWIRPTVLGCNRDELGLEADDYVCYVLSFRSLADLLVIDKACENAQLPRPSHAMQDDIEKHAFFFLGHPEGRLGRKSLRAQSERMTRLFEHQQRLEGPIKIVPVSLFWGHQPDQEKSLFKLLLSENWSATSRFRKLLAIIFHPHHILVQFCQPIQITELMQDRSERQLQIRKLLRILRVHFTRQKQAILGPDLSHRRTLINSMVTSNAVRDAIRREAEEQDTSIAKVEKKAQRYAREIASDQSYRVVRFFHFLLTWLWNKLYDGIDMHNIDQVKELAASNEIVYTPCHRSHIDYLLLSYVLYQNGLTPPHIAAGKNLNLPLVGPLLRRGGAFFMRRSFRGDPLYQAVFDEYLHLMFIRGYSVEYFIEGGRSRTGRTLVPRTGLLSMTMRSFQRDSSRPMSLMPVHFSYERIIEAPTYMSELAGKDKKQESFFDIFKIFGVFKNSFGKVVVNFGEPISMQEFLDENLPHWSTPERTDRAAFSAACVALSRKIATNINAAATVNPINLVATVLLSTPRQIIEEKRLQGQLEVLRELAGRIPGYGRTIVTSLTPSEIVEEAGKVAGIERRRQPFGDIISAPADVTVLLTWYRNSTAHLFALPSLIARIVRTREKVSIADIIDACNVVYPYLRSEFFLKWQPEEVPEACRRVIEELHALDLLRTDNEFVGIPEPTSEQFACLFELAEIIEPTLERFYLVAALLQQHRELAIAEVETDAGAIARQMSTLYGINSPEFFERSLFSTFVETLRTHGVISPNGGVVEIDEDKFLPLKTAAEATLDPDVRYNVLQAVERLGAE